ncbi:unnamed protein product [Effrenium voratum]|nr:unnamed protein product [Effrenium voratum]
MDASIPGRYGFRRKAEQRQAALDRNWAEVSQLVEAVPRAPRPALAICWEELPKALDPAEGELDQGRAQRKRRQVESLAAYALAMLDPGAAVVEFGAGSGHLGLLVAYLAPSSHVILVEAKEYSCKVARARVENTGIGNCGVFQGTVDEFAGTGQDFGLALGLHTCGLLADAVLRLAQSRQAAVCLVPCCYGQVSSKENHHRGQGTELHMHPCSQAMAEVSFAWCAKAADFTPGKGGAFDAESPGFQTALRCMQVVDTDRLLFAQERSGYKGELGLLDPGCSPKCSVICLRPQEAAAREPAAEQKVRVR